MDFGQYKDCRFTFSRYRNNNGLYIGLENHEGPIIDLTTNVSDDLATDEIAINDDNSPINTPAWMEQNNVAANTGRSVRSGWVRYPIMKVLPEFLNKYQHEFDKHL